MEQTQTPEQLQSRVTALGVIGDTWFAATSQGLFRSSDRGNSWTLVPAANAAGMTAGAGDYLTLADDGKHIFAGSRESIIASEDGGLTWKPVIFPTGLTALAALALAPDGTLWAGGREGVFYSPDDGHTWTAVRRLPVVAVNSLTWNPSEGRLIVTCGVGTIVYSVDPRDQSWRWWNTGWTVHSVASLKGRLVAASLYSGVVVQPAAETSARAGDPVQQDARR
jgi:photosystem II stability/assembly factor-like uncharacterized protein